MCDISWPCRCKRHMANFAMLLHSKQVVTSRTNFDILISPTYRTCGGIPSDSKSTGVFHGAGTASQFYPGGRRPVHGPAGSEPADFRIGKRAGPSAFLPQLPQRSPHPGRHGVFQKMSENSGRIPGQRGGRPAGPGGLSRFPNPGHHAGHLRTKAAHTLSALSHGLSPCLAAYPWL